MKLGLMCHRIQLISSHIGSLGEKIQTRVLTYYNLMHQFKVTKEDLPPWTFTKSSTMPWSAVYVQGTDCFPQARHELQQQEHPKGSNINSQATPSTVKERERDVRS